ncbi:MAG: ATP-binding protein [Thermoproteota archaeon]
MPLELPKIADEIGVVISGATASIAPIVLRRDKEIDVHEEDIVLIADSRIDGYYMLGTVRWITRFEPFLKRSVHNVYVEHPDALDSDLIMPFSNAYVEIYAGLCDGGVVCRGSQRSVSNVYPPTPGSRVYLIRDANPITSYLTVNAPIHVGTHKYSKWRVPLDSAWINYHVGVFGATGMGKSRLVLKLVQELSAKGFGLIVFDHSGVDYVPFAKALGAKLVDAGRIRISPDIFSAVVSRFVDVSGQQRDVIEVAAMCFAISKYGGIESGVGGSGPSADECREFLKTGGHRTVTLRDFAKHDEKISDFGELVEAIESVGKKLNLREATIVKLKLLTKLKVPPELVNSLKERNVEPQDIVADAVSGGVVIVDMSSERDVEVKRGIVASIAQAAWSFTTSTDKLNLGLVVDEAQNYACEYCGESGRALETIAREGRKWGYFVIVASQRVTRDIRPGVRSNLGTVFFSKLQATGDLQELSGYLDMGRVTEASLSMLSRKEFYVAGLMNPLRRPILLTVDDVSNVTTT